MANNKYLDSNGLLYFWQKIKNTFVSDANYVHTDNNYTTAEKDKLSGIEAGAEVNDVTDVQVNGTSIMSGGIANVPAAKSNAYGVVKVALTTNTGGGPSKLSITYKDLGGNEKNTSFPIGTAPALSNFYGYMSGSDKIKLDKLKFDSNNLIDSSILPSYVDDVIEAYPVSGATELSATWLSLTSSGTALTPESGKIYVLMADSTSYTANSQFRWGGSTYVKLSSGADISNITNAEIDTIVAS